MGPSLICFLLASIITLTCLNQANAGLCPEQRKVLIEWLVKRVVHYVQYPNNPTLPDPVQQERRDATYLNIWTDQAKEQLEDDLTLMQKEPVIGRKFKLNKKEKDYVVSEGLIQALSAVAFNKGKIQAKVQPEDVVDQPPELVPAPTVQDAVAAMAAAMKAKMEAVVTELVKDLTANIQYDPKEPVMIDQADKRVKSKWMTSLREVGMTADDTGPFKTAAIVSVIQKHDGVQVASVDKVDPEEEPVGCVTAGGWKSFRETMGSLAKALRIGKKKSN